MDMIDVNGVRLAFEQIGQGPPVVCVHGAWTDRHAWNLVVPSLAPRHRVITYDRRGHSRSRRAPDAHRVSDHVADLAALIDRLDAAPAHLVTNSFGGEVALKVAARHPALVASLCLHEPPLLGMLDDDPALHELVEDLAEREDRVVAEIEGGSHRSAARLFVETMALGPGAWQHLPGQLRRTMADNAPTFLVGRDPAWGVLRRDELAGITVPVLLTGGANSPPPHAAILDRLAAALPTVERHTFADAGHIPHRTHPDELVTVVGTFLDRVGRRPESARTGSGS